MMMSMPAVYITGRTAAPTAAYPILSIANLSRHFGALTVLESIDLKVASGEILGILGPNGAGKSTLFNLIAGVMPPSSGNILFRDRDIVHDKPWTRARAGIGRTYQIPKPFRQISTYENALVAATQGRRISVRDARDDVDAVMELTGLAPKAEMLARDLPLLDLKRLELAKALALRPKLLLLDEIAGGLTDGECDVLLDIIHKLNGQGTTIVWIEHVIHVLMRAVERLAVLNEGKIVAIGDPAAIMANPQVQQVYLGV